MKTASLEISKRLVEAGITLETMFSYPVIGLQEPALTDCIDPMYITCPAPTADELGELLPLYWFKHLPERYGVDCITNVLCLNATIEMVGNADKIAEYLLWLKENGHV